METEKKSMLVFTYLQHKFSGYQTAINIVGLLSFLIFFFGFFSWPFYSGGWKFVLSAIALFAFYYFFNLVLKKAIDEIKDKTRITLEYDETYFDAFLEIIRKDNKFVNRFKMVYGEYLIDLTKYTLDQIAAPLVGKTLVLNNATINLTKIPQIIYYLGEIRDKPNGLDAIRFSNGLFTDQSESGQTLKEYLIAHV